MNEKTSLRTECVWYLWTIEIQFVSCGTQKICVADVRNDTPQEFLDYNNLFFGPFWISWNTQFRCRRRLKAEFLLWVAQVIQTQWYDKYADIYIYKYIKTHKAEISGIIQLRYNYAFVHYWMDFIACFVFLINKSIFFIVIILAEENIYRIIDDD